MNNIVEGGYNMKVQKKAEVFRIGKKRYFYKNWKWQLFWEFLGCLLLFVNFYIFSIICYVLVKM